VANGAAYQIAIVYAGRGNANRTFEWLESAYRQRDAEEIRPAAAAVPPGSALQSAAGGDAQGLTKHARIRK
jgi:hypothetical protein